MEKTPVSMLPIWLLAAMMIMMYFWRFWEPCANAMLVVLLPKFWFGLKIMTGHNCFWMSSWGSPLLDPKKLQNQQFYKIDWIRKKVLVDVANLATCCHDDYDALLKVLGTLGKCYASSPVAKTLEIMTGTTVFGCLPGAHSPLLDPKKLQNEQFYKIDWIWKKLLVDVANLATCCHDDDIWWWWWCAIGCFGNPVRMLC